MTREPQPFTSVPAEAADVLRPVLPGLADEIIAAIADEVPDYARAMEGEFGNVVRMGVERALGRFVDLIEDPRGGSARARETYVNLGRGEVRAGRSLDALLAAYRVGARLAWRRFVEAGVAGGLEPGGIYTLGEAIFAYIDEISAESAEGYAEEQSAAAGELQRRRRRLVRLLIEEPPASDEAILAAAAAASWPLPPTIAALVAAPGPAAAGGDREGAASATGQAAPGAAGAASAGRGAASAAGQAAPGAGGAPSAAGRGAAPAAGAATSVAAGGPSLAAGGGIAPAAPLAAPVGAEEAAEADALAARLARRVGEGAVGAGIEGLACVLVPDPDAPGRRRRLEAAAEDRPAALGPAVPLAAAARTVRRAAATHALLAAGRLPAGRLAVAEEHLPSLLLAADPGLAGELAEQRLAPLAALPDGPRARLTETLRAWLDRPGQVQAIAAELGVHPQTVRYRVRQLRELFGDRLEDPDARFELGLALRAG
jgi:hypothetical protein